jgi:type IV pilus assembly protein PilQ
VTRARGPLLTALFCLVCAGPQGRATSATRQRGGADGQTPVRAATSPCAGPRIYTGAPIDVDFQGSDLRTTLRLLADEGGLNLVLDPSVPPTATVDLKLTQVPWDQAVDLVLRGGQLTCVAEGTVIRVLTREARTKEIDQEALQRRAAEQLEMEPLQMRLNYSSAAALRDLIKQGRIISDRGTVDVDQRTNTLLVKDTPRNLQEVRDLIHALDLPEPQVEIEAQIVETDHDSARALGIQWGLNGRASPELGNTTGVAFPNSVTAGGRVGAQQGAGVGDGADPRASALERSSTAVDLAAAGASSAMGVTLGAINGAFNLDLALSALEHQGRLKILSKPKVTTQNNREAEVATGFQVPFQTVSNNTVVVQFRDAALKLTVLPQVTAGGMVIMRITLSNDFPDFSRAVNGNPSINTQRASTEVQVADGMTTVIGGINQVKEQAKNDRTPGIASVPLLGRLFRRSEVSAETQELFIFITPRVLPVATP